MSKAPEFDATKLAAMSDAELESYLAAIEESRTWTIERVNDAPAWEVTEALNDGRLDHLLGQAKQARPK